MEGGDRGERGTRAARWLMGTCGWLVHRSLLGSGGAALNAVCDSVIPTKFSSVQNGTCPFSVRK